MSFTLNYSLFKYLYQLCMVGNVGHLRSVGRARCAVAMISNSAQTLSLVVNDAHELSAGQGPGSINLLTPLLHQTAHSLSGTGESHMIIG